MYRTHNCGELRLKDVGKQVSLSGWVQSGRDLGGLTFIDLRDRYGITQLVFSMDDNVDLCERARKLGREFVIAAKGVVNERSNKNMNRETGDIELMVDEFEILNPSKVPPFTIEDDTDGGDELRMKYRYLDIRRNPVKNNLIFRSKCSLEVRKYLDEQGFIEIETPFLIKSTPEGARDFVVPSRLNQGTFYALPQSPQTFKQLLMVSGMDKYYQIVKCFRDEDLRADRQPEFTQIDCEMAFIHRDDVLDNFEGLTRHLFKSLLYVNLDEFPRISYDDALKYYGSDKPDIRFDMKFTELSELAKGKGFSIFDEAELIVGICVKNVNLSNKELKELTEWLRRPQIGAQGMVYISYNEDGTLKSSIGKYFTEEELNGWKSVLNAEQRDLVLILSGEKERTRKQMSELRLEMARRLGLMKDGDFKPLWVIDFPLLEWDEEEKRFFAMHHPFTSPKRDEIEKMMSGDLETLKNLKADAYDLVINGNEIGGGSIRIHDRELQEKNFNLLGFTPEEAEKQFGFLMGAFEYGAPPHGGIAFGFDRLCAVMNNQTTIRDYIAFPKNNQGKDIMIDAPDTIDDKQLDELGLILKTVNNYQ
ncbi:MAG: aspartate--tRNA ligase [Saprospiraceae bacterium]|nr:aspartate--tRNA ligase [Saprospiraceae bacterium]